jgi:exonuclease SbcC
MRLHELRLHAVGPFVDEQVVDFDRLSVSGLFLLEGPTGVGKSTVLDAVTFALYGSVTGAASDAGRLGSDFSAAGIAPRVQLELSVRGERLRITRTPEYERPKRRGTGMIKERPTAHLEVWREGSWVSRSARQDEIGEYIGEQLGLSREQFRQVVLLPQGEFAGFLRADDDGRRAVLVKLFGTQFFERLAAVLQRRATQARAAVAERESELRALAAVAWEASGRDPEEDAERPLTWEQQVADLESIRGLVAERASIATAAAVDARLDAEAARAVASDAREVATRVAERDALAAEREVLEGERAEQAERQARVERARRVLPIRPLLGLLDSAASHAAETLCRLSRLGLADDADRAAERARELADAASAAERTLAGLSHVVELEAGLDGVRDRVFQARATLELNVEQHARLEAQTRDLPVELEAVRGEIDDVERTVLAAELAERELGAAVRRLDAAIHVVEIEERILELRADERAARRRYDEARDHVAVVVEQRIAGFQGELAARLVSGEACLVCGSVEHPAPAATDRDLVGEDVLTQSEGVRDDAMAAWELAVGAVASLEASCAAMRAVADGASVEGAQALVTELTARAAAGAEAAAELLRLRERRVAVEAAQTDARDELVRCSARLATAEAEVGRVDSELSNAEAVVARHRDGHGSVAVRCDALDRSARSARDAAQVLTEHQRALEVLGAARDTALAAAGAAGVADLDELREWVLGQADIEHLDQQARAWEARLGMVTAKLDAQPLLAVQGLSREWVCRVVDAAGAVLEEATVRAHAAAARAARAEQSSELYEKRVSAVRDAVSEWSRVATEAAEVMAVDDYVRGTAGKPRMTLSTFVLRYWFEQVVAAANVRLQTMSNGKYELLRVERGARAASRVGLGLAVLDRHTGRERGTETLSGGETFYTSLALALGLADVVVAEAGGAQLDTLFIDEGFGSLDGETLDEVMSVIDELRGHGRVVGVVSHVAELNERIPERLSIRRVRPDGPSTLQVVA